MDSISAGNIRTRINHYRSSRWLAILLGCLIISAWTLIRFFDNGPTFDQIGQQVLAHQWLHGFHSGSVVGPTNYVLKMLFFYIPLDLVPLPAQFKLVFMTLSINIITFVFLIYGLEKIWREFYPKLKDSFYIPVIYLALISGSVYWIAFTNSRNLEVAGGVWLIYLCLRAQAHPSRRQYGLLIILGSVLFFADPLQIYMSLLPALIFIVIRAACKKDRRQTTVLLKIFGCVALSILVARIFTRIIESAWGVSFIITNQSISLTPSSIKLAAEQMARLYAGGFEAGRPREVIDLLVVASSVIGAVYCAWRKPKSRWLLALAGIVWAVDLGVYIISGQAQQPDTNRYLIMTVPLFILVIAAILYYLPSTNTRLYVVVLVLLFNFLTLASTFATTWNPGFSHNNHDRSAITYLLSHKYSYGYASISTALSSDYLSKWKANLLPLGCDPGSTLKMTNLFFDKSAFMSSHQPAKNTLVPIVLDEDNITISPSVCSADQIKRQLGPWERIDYLSDGSMVLLYNKVGQLPTAWR